MARHHSNVLPQFRPHKSRQLNRLLTRLKLNKMKPSGLIATQRDRILAIAAAHGVSNLGVIGSVAKGLNKEGSDLDLLVEIQPGTSLIQFAGLQMDTEEAVGLKRDLCTEAQLHPKLKDRTLSDALPL
jgi:predicted nucleotidyltransferase